jgi:predicted O-methyltransferase YrrM
MMQDVSAQLTRLLGESDNAARAWADGYGIVSPDVVRYSDVLSEEPDAIELAMRNLAASSQHTIIDPATATLIGLLTALHHPLRIFEAGAGIGYVTLQMARRAPDDCTIVSVEGDPMLHGHAHAFLERAGASCALELRLGNVHAVLRESDESFDMLVLTDARLDRAQLIIDLVPAMAPGGLVVVPRALEGGRVADATQAWGGEARIAQQRRINRIIATSPHLTDVVLVPIGDGLLLARKVR